MAGAGATSRAAGRLPARAYVAALVALGCLVSAMVAIAAWDPFSWHAYDAGYPSLAAALTVAGVVTALGTLLSLVGRRFPQAGLFLAGCTGVTAGVLGNVAGWLTIRALGGGNSAADIWSEPVIWYVGNPADAAIVLGAILLLVWLALRLLPRTRQGLAAALLTVVAVGPLLAVGGYGVARTAEVTGWQPRPLEQLTRVVVHQAGLAETPLDRACAAQFAATYHRPTSTDLTSAICPPLLREAAKDPHDARLILASRPPSTFGHRAPAGPPSSDERRPTVVVTVGPDGRLQARLVTPTTPRPKPSPVARRLLDAAQRRELPCVKRLLTELAPTAPRFEALAVEVVCRVP
jgi:hypothetical protein